MNPFACLADAPRLLQHPCVRDLAWIIVSPALLSDATGNPRHALQATPWAARPQALLGWLHDLDAVPHALLDWLAQRPVRRLGLYYERLWQFAIMQAPGIELLAANLPVHLEGRTLGEFDLLLRDEEGCHHLELAVKFYLARSDTDGRETQHWLGPGSHDRLDLKFAQMRGPQLALSTTPAARALLAEHQLEQPAPALWLGGYLFQPWPQGCATPSVVATDHLTGRWLHRQQWPSFLARKTDSCWQPLPKLAWLAPACLDASHRPTHEPVFNAAREPFRPTLLARLEPQQDGRWEEVERIFVVPDDWPQAEPDCPAESQSL